MGSTQVLFIVMKMLQWCVCCVCRGLQCWKLAEGTVLGAGHSSLRDVLPSCSYRSGVLGLGL